jgi:hypothetical protein
MAKRLASSKQQLNGFSSEASAADSASEYNKTTTTARALLLQVLSSRQHRNAPGL